MAKVTVNRPEPTITVELTLDEARYVWAAMQHIGTDKWKTALTEHFCEGGDLKDAQERRNTVERALLDRLLPGRVRVYVVRPQRRVPLQGVRVMTQMTKLEILEETIEFYSVDPAGRRSIDTSVPGGGGCLYRGPNNRSCAFGRCMTPETLAIVPEAYALGATEVLVNLGRKFDDPYRRLTADDVVEHPVVEERYAGHPIWFWEDLQWLHDFNVYWGTNGLTASGAAEADRLRKKFTEEEATS